MAKAKAKKNEQAVKATKTTGKTVNVALISYWNEQFFDFLKEQKGALILDARMEGKSKVRSLESAVLKRKFGDRYALVPGLGYKKGLHPSKWIEQIQDSIAKIVNTIDRDHPVIIVGPHTGHLRAIGHIVAKATPKAVCQIKYYFKDNPEGQKFRDQLVEYISSEDLVELIRSFTEYYGMEATSKKAVSASEFGF